MTPTGTQTGAAQMAKTYTLNQTGETVTSKTGEWPTIYTNRTQAYRAAAKIEGATVIQRGRPFYVRLSTPQAER